MSINLPLPLQLVLDDVGWWSGKNDSANNGPFRTGITRDHCVEDYEAIVSLGQQLGVRPAAAFVACEWDAKNILRELPESTWMGAGWDNRWARQGTLLTDAARVLREHRGRHLELTLHGVAHEFWPDGTMQRANWHNRNGVMWPRHQLRAQLHAYQAILDQHGLGPMPDSFAPCAGLYRFDAEGHGLASLLAEFGVRYNGEPFIVMHRDTPTQHPRFGVEAGVLTIDRQPDVLPWFAIDPALDFHVPGPICGMHWPNILHPDPRRNQEVVDRWVRFLRPIDHDFTRMLSTSTADCWTQYVHHLTVQAWREGDGFEFDFRALDALPAMPLQETFHVKISAAENARFESTDFSIEPSWDRVGQCHRVKLRRLNKSARARMRVV